MEAKTSTFIRANCQYKTICTNNKCTFMHPAHETLVMKTILERNDCCVCVGGKECIKGKSCQMIHFNFSKKEIYIIRNCAEYILKREVDKSTSNEQEKEDDLDLNLKSVNL